MTEATKRLDHLLKAHAIRAEDYLLLKSELDRYHALMTAIRKSTLVRQDGDRMMLIEYPYNPEWRKV